MQVARLSGELEAALAAKHELEGKWHPFISLLACSCFVYALPPVGPSFSLGSSPSLTFSLLAPLEASSCWLFVLSAPIRFALTFRHARDLLACLCFQPAPQRAGACSLAEKSLGESAARCSQVCRPAAAAVPANHVVRRQRALGVASNPALANTGNSLFCCCARIAYGAGKLWGLEDALRGKQELEARLAQQASALPCVLLYCPAALLQRCAG